jgi:hypothetical protein
VDDKRKPLYLLWDEEAFLSDETVRFMTYIQRWMYRALLQSAFICSTRPFLPSDDKVLWVLAGCKSEAQWREHSVGIRSAFTVIDVDGKKLLSQKRLCEEWERITKERKRLALLSKAGVKGNALRWDAYRKATQKAIAKRSPGNQEPIAKQSAGDSGPESVREVE